MMTDQFDEPIYQLRNMISNWGYDVRLRDIINRMTDLLVLTNNQNDKQIIKVMITTLQNMKRDET